MPASPARCGCPGHDMRGGPPWSVRGSNRHDASMNADASPQTLSGPIERVMVGTDRSETAERAVRWAASFSDAFGAELHIVQVIVPSSPADTEHGAAEATRARSAADDLQTYARSVAGDRAHGHVVIHDDPAMAIVRGHRGAGDRRARRRQRRHGRPQGVPARQRAQPHQPQRAVHGDHREHGRRRPGGRRRPSHAVVARACELGRTRGVPAAPDRAGADRIAAVFAKHGLKELFGRPDQEGAVGRHRQGKRLRAALEELGPTFAKLGQILSTRPGPASPRVHRGARDPAGQRAPAHGAGRRRGHGAGARRAVGGRVRPHRSGAARGRHDRRGAPGHARDRRSGGREGAAPRRAGADRAGPRPARGLRGEGRRPSRAAAGDRHAGGLRAPVELPASRARLPAGGREHGADARDRGAVLAAARAGRAWRPLDLAAARHDRRAGRPDLARPRRAGSHRGRAPAARELLQADHGRRLLPRRPAPGQPDVASGRRHALPAGPRHGGRGRAGDARAADAAADGLLAGRRALPHRRLAHARGRHGPQRPRRRRVRR